TRFSRDWSSDVCSSDLAAHEPNDAAAFGHPVVEARAQHQHTTLIQMAGRRQGMLLIAVRMHDQAGGGAMPERREDFAIHAQEAKIGRASCRERDETSGN